MPFTVSQFINTTNGERSANTRLGKWARAVGRAWDLGTNQHCVSKLRAASGEISLRSREGRWAMKVSKVLDAAGLVSAADLTAMMQKLVSSSGEHSLRCRVGRMERVLSGVQP